MSPIKEYALRLSAKLVWKSWMAALCAVLVAFVALEQASPTHASDIRGSIGVSLTASDVASTSTVDIAESDTGAPLGDTQQQRHHCCGAHPTGAPPPAHANLPPRLAEALTPEYANDIARDRAPAGLERPPKAATLV